MLFEPLVAAHEPTEVQRLAAAAEHRLDGRLDAARVDPGARRDLLGTLQGEAVHQEAYGKDDIYKMRGDPLLLTQESKR